MVNVYETHIITDYDGRIKLFSTEKGDEMKLLRGEKGGKIDCEEFPKEYREIIKELTKLVKNGKIKNSVLELKIIEVGSI